MAPKPTPTKHTSNHQNNDPLNMTSIITDMHSIPLTPSDRFKRVIGPGISFKPKPVIETVPDRWDWETYYRGYTGASKKLKCLFMGCNGVGEVQHLEVKGLGGDEVALGPVCRSCVESGKEGKVRVSREDVKLVIIIRNL